MSAREVSITTQLKKANAEIAEHKLHIETLTKKLSESEKSKDSWYKNYETANNELSQVHTLLDSVPNPPPSTLTDNQYAKLNVLTRLSVFFATRNGVQNG